MRKPALKVQIEEFRQTKTRLISVLTGLGIVGLVLPILPGVAFLVLAFSLALPKQADSVLRRFRGSQQPERGSRHV